MSLLSEIVQAAVEAKAPLFFPSWVFPLIAASVFTALGLVVWSFRDVSNRHQKNSGSAAGGPPTGH